jgi:hypothetical protein
MRGCTPVNSVPIQCAGTAKTCAASATDLACVYAGCTLSFDACEGTRSPCEIFNEAECAEQDGCTFVPPP